jgi:DNA-binding MarR family transcriptional regulator
MSNSTTPTGAERSDGTRWLSAAELAAWQSITLVLARLPTALEVQLQRDAQLSYVEYYVLAGLSEQPDHSMQLSELAVLTNAEQSRISHLVTRLEKRGYLRRVPHPGDRRCTNAVLTDEGYQHLRAAAPGHVATVRSLVFDALEDNQLDALKECADQIIARVGSGTRMTCRRDAKG